MFSSQIQELRNTNEVCHFFKVPNEHKWYIQQTCDVQIDGSGGRETCILCHVYLQVVEIWKIRYHISFPYELNWKQKFRKKQILVNKRNNKS